MQSDTQTKGKIYLLMAYLGSGKTTFIRNVLNNKHSQKFAIIQNQFASGQMGIEQPLITDESGTPFSNFLELPNGCICCSAKNDLVASIEYILSNTNVKNIIVETNGLADPAESIKQFWFDEEMKINGQLHSVISIFSVRKFPELKGKQLFEKQIIFANKALITFVDKSTEDQTKGLEAYISQNNPQCSIQRNTNFDVIDFLSGPNLFAPETLSHIKNHHQKSSTSGSEHSHNDHHHGISSIFIKGTCTLKTSKQAEMSVGELLWESGLKVLRIKGVYCLENYQSVFELQGVDDLFQIKESQTKNEKYESLTKILVIGQNIEGQEDKIYNLLKITPSE